MVSGRYVPTVSGKHTDRLKTTVMTTGTPGGGGGQAALVAAWLFLFGNYSENCPSSSRDNLPPVDRQRAEASSGNMITRSGIDRSSDRYPRVQSFQKRAYNRLYLFR